MTWREDEVDGLGLHIGLFALRELHILRAAAMLDHLVRVEVVAKERPFEADGGGLFEMKGGGRDFQPAVLHLLRIVAFGVVVLALGGHLELDAVVRERCSCGGEQDADDVGGNPPERTPAAVGE